MYIRIILFLSFIGIFYSCVEESEVQYVDDANGEVYKNLFAKGFQITLGDDDGTYSISFFDEIGNFMEEFFLYPQGYEGTDLIPGTKIEIPVQNVACQSTTHTSFFSFLDSRETVKGVAFAHLLNNEPFKELLKNGQIINLSTADEIDFELLIGLNPDILLVYPFGDSNFDKYENAGIPCVPISEYKESSPLAQAEWIKVIGLLLNRYDEADSLFNDLVERYEKVKTEVAENTINEDKPTVFTGSFWKGNWKAPSGKSLIAQYIKDAGATYVFDDYQESGNIELDFEEFIMKAFSADYFGKVIYEGDSISRDKMIDNDERLRELKSYKSYQMFYCNSEQTDYFGDAIMQPEIILSDLVNIFWNQDLQHQNKYFHLVND